MRPDGEKERGSEVMEILQRVRCTSEARSVENGACQEQPNGQAWYEANVRRARLRAPVVGPLFTFEAPEVPAMSGCIIVDFARFGASSGGARVCVSEQKHTLLKRG